MTADELDDYLAERMGAEVSRVHRLPNAEDGSPRYWVILTRGDGSWGEIWDECPPGFDTTVGDRY